MYGNGRIFSTHEKKIEYRLFDRQIFHEFFKNIRITILHYIWCCFWKSIPAPQYHVKLSQKPQLKKTFKWPNVVRCHYIKDLFWLKTLTGHKLDICTPTHKTQHLLKGYLWNFRKSGGTRMIPYKEPKFWKMQPLNFCVFILLMSLHQRYR